MPETETCGLAPRLVLRVRVSISSGFAECIATMEATQRHSGGTIAGKEWRDTQAPAEERKRDRCLHGLSLLESPRRTRQARSVESLECFSRGRRRQGDNADSRRADDTVSDLVR